MYLNCHSYHSLRYGTIPVEDLVDQAALHGVDALALTDINTVTGIYEFIKSCWKQSIKPIVGAEIRDSNNQLLYITLAMNQSGVGEINRLLTQYLRDKKELPVRAPYFDKVMVIYPLGNVPETLNTHEYIGIRQEELTYLIRSEWKNRISQMVILHPVTFRNQQEYTLHRILRAIDQNVVLSKLSPRNCCTERETMTAKNILENIYCDYPEIITNTRHIIESCHIDFDFNKIKNVKHYTGSKEGDREKLRTLAYQGLKKRYGEGHELAKARIEKELKVIHELGFSGNFLITWDIICYSNSQGFMHIGRGSGANSIVSYCIGITDICPLELNLYFERFLNLNRKVPPDFDIDWSWKDRDTIVQYIIDKYGKDHVAFCGTTVEFKYRSIVREIGKVFGLPKEELDMLTIAKNRLDDEGAIIKSIRKYGEMLTRYPNQRSMHACGILISESPLTDYTALEMPPKGFPVIQFDMNAAEKIGFEKLDILSQRGIGHINDTVKLIKQNQCVEVDIRNTALSKNEAKANEFLSKGNTIGCFYVESPAMRGLLRRLKCDNYITLVAASSIIRPGVAQSGMMRQYIYRHNNPDQFEYFHPIFEEQLGETYGIMVYQEDVIKIALHYGGLEEADGDVLRRAMDGRKQVGKDLELLKEKFFASCERKGYPDELNQEVYRQISSFAQFSFCKAHSASYAVESYQSLYLKAYYPLEFMVAVINNQGGFYDTEVYVHETRMSGGNVLNPCVNQSEYETTLYGQDIYLGLMHLQSLEMKIARLIPQERMKNGRYYSLEDFIRRIPIGLEGIQVLIYIDAFRFTGKGKSELLIEARLLLVSFVPEYRTPILLDEPMKQYHLPVLHRNVFEDAFDELELLGFTVSCTPFDLLQTKYRGAVMVKDLLNHHRKEVKMLGYLIAQKHVRTKAGDMYFGTWIDAEGAYFDTAHFSNSSKHYPFQGRGCYLLLGIVEVDFGFPTITITKMAKMPYISDPRYN